MKVIHKCIYLIRDRKTQEIRYIGLTSNFSRRKKEHLKRMKESTLPLYCWMRKRTFSFSILQDHSNSTEEQLQQAEIYWIKHFRALGCPLLNCTDGGGLLNPTSEIRQKISIAKKLLYKNPEQNPAYGTVSKKRKPFLCIQTGKIYQHIREAAADLGVDRASIGKTLRHSRPRHAGGYNFIYINENK